MDVQRARVLVIEDDTDSQEVVSRILRYMRIAVDVVSSSEEAMEVLDVQPYDLAVVDLALPKMDGWGLLNFIRNHPTSGAMATVAVTAFHSPEVAVKAIEAGFSAYFPKPLDTTEFVRQLQELLN